MYRGNAFVEHASLDLSWRNVYKDIQPLAPEIPSISGRVPSYLFRNSSFRNHFTEEATSW